MQLQVLKDGNGNNSGIFINMADWEKITQKHADLKKLVDTNNTPKIKLSELAGTLSHETAEDMLKYVKKSRKGSSKDLKKQLTISQSTIPIVLSENPDFMALAGIWKGKDITLAELRKKAWGDRL
jgi:adenine-specific DNA glycosylase